MYVKDLVQTFVGSSVSEFIGVLVMLIYRALFSWCPPFLLAGTLFLPPLPQSSLSCEERDSMEIFRAVLRSLSGQCLAVGL